MDQNKDAPKVPSGTWCAGMQHIIIIIITLIIKK